MAWIDDRIWCHPKLAGITDRAFRVHVHAIAYSSGFGTGGHLTPGQLRTIGTTPKTTKLLLNSGLWEASPGGGIFIHDWDDHNGKRDARKAADRERKRQERARQRPQDSPQDAPQDAPRERRQDRRALTSDGSEERPTVTVTVTRDAHPEPDPVTVTETATDNGWGFQPIGVPDIDFGANR